MLEEMLMAEQMIPYVILSALAAVTVAMAVGALMTGVRKR